MDSLDTWLNRQRGWRHFAVALLVGLPAGVALSAVWVASSNLTDPTTLGASVASGRMALGVAASVPFAVLIFSIETVSRRRAARRGKIRTPRYLWRGIVGIYLLIGDNAYSVWAEAHTLQWRQRHDSSFVFLVQVALDVISVALIIWNAQYWRRLKRRTAEVAITEPGWL